MANTFTRLQHKLTQAISGINKAQSLSGVEELIRILREDLFLHAYTRDVAEQLETSVNDLGTGLKWINIIDSRLKYLHHWNSEHNQTIDLIRSGQIPVSEIKPHIRLSDQDYENFYQAQNEKIFQRLHKHNEPFSRFKSHQKLKFNGHYDHCMRKAHALSVIESHMAIVEKMDTKVNKKWLDVGCGNGLITNAVDSSKFASGKWKIAGCDLQESKIKIAQKKACKYRSFFQQNVLKQLKDNAAIYDQYDIISMFEFCEHFADPMSLLKEIAQFDFKIMVVATPLSQKTNFLLDKAPDPVHLWSFSVQAMSEMLKQAGLEVIYDSQIRVGQHTKGLNWLTVVACKPRYFEFFNQF